MSPIEGLLKKTESGERSESSSMSMNQKKKHEESSLKICVTSLRVTQNPTAIEVSQTLKELPCIRNVVLDEAQCTSNKPGGTDWKVSNVLFA